MSSNVGLSTPRGSGTSGYVQRNLSVLKPRDAGVGVPYTLDGNNRGGPKTRKPDEDILKHDRLREIEVKVLELRDTLEDAGKDDDEIETETEKLRERLTQEMERGSKKGAGGAAGSKSRLKSYQVHEMAEAKERESERLRRALGLKAGEVPEDGEHPMARQEKRRRKKEEEDADAPVGPADDAR